MPEIAAKQTEFERVVRNRIDHKFINYAQKLGEELRFSEKNKQLSKSQIRRIFAAVKSLEMRVSGNLDNAEILILLPRLAYACKRDSAVKPLADELSAGIRTVAEDGISKEERTRRFRTLSQAFEAVLAYHKDDEKGDRNNRPQRGSESRD